MSVLGSPSVPGKLGGFVVLALLTNQKGSRWTRAGVTCQSCLWRGNHSWAKVKGNLYICGRSLRKLKECKWCPTASRNSGINNLWHSGSDICQKMSTYFTGGTWAFELKVDSPSSLWQSQLGCSGRSIPNDVRLAV